MRVIASESVGLIIDIQTRLHPLIHENEMVTRNTQILIQGLKALGIPLVVTEQYVQGLGPTIEPLKEHLQDIIPIEKLAFSCCDEPKFDMELASLGKKFVIIAGIETHVCVLQTVLDLIERGYVPVVVENCISSRTAHDKQIAIARMQQEGAYISTYESILFELTRVSKTPVFKIISGLVK